jgi:hypothetical protein
LADQPASQSDLASALAILAEAALGRAQPVASARGMRQAPKRQRHLNRVPRRVAAAGHGTTAKRGLSGPKAYVR